MNIVLTNYNLFWVLRSHGGMISTEIHQYLYMHTRFKFIWQFEEDSIFFPGSQIYDSLRYLSNLKLCFYIPFVLDHLSLSPPQKSTNSQFNMGRQKYLIISLTEFNEEHYGLLIHLMGSGNFGLITTRGMAEIKL